MKINKIHTICIVILIFSSLYLVKDLFKPNFFTSHDGHHQLIRMAVFDQGIKDGQFPVRWAGSALEGYGYPLFVFTYRTPFILGQILRTVFALNYMWVIKLTFALSYLFSALVMFLVLLDLTKKRLASLMGVFVYIIAPYRFSNIFVRASLGEASAFVFWPLIFWSIISLDKKKKWPLLLGSISLALALMSHAMVFFIFAPFIGGVYLYKIIKVKKKLHFIKLAIMQGILFLLLSAYYWIPAFFEKIHTVFDSVFSSHYDKHFPTFKQLIYSPWGYGFSMPGVLNDAMSFQVGIGQWVGVGLAVIFLFVYLFRKKKKINKEKKELMFLSLVFFTVSIFMMLRFSTPAWQLLTDFLALDFPWRYLSVSVFFAAFAFAFFLSLQKKAMQIILSLFLMVLLIYTNRNHLKINQEFSYDDKQLINSIDTSNSYEDYKPKYISGVKLSENDDFFQKPSGKAEYRLQSKKSNEAIIQAKVESDDASVLLKMAYFPGWQVLVDGEEKEIVHDGGKIRLNLNKGDHLIRIVLKESNTQRIANLLSLFGVLAAVLFFLKRKF